MGFRASLVATLLLLSAGVAHAEIEVETSSLGHGVKAWYAEDHSVPVVDIVLSFEGAGSVSDPEGKSGRAAFAASMLTEGAGTLDSAAFQRALEEKAITLTAEAEEDRLTIHLYCLREHAARAGELLALALSKPQLAEADQVRMKAELTSLVSQLEESPGYQARRLLASRAFKGHPYSNPMYGDKASIAKLSAQDIRDYLATYVTRGNVLVAASGDVGRDLLDEMLEPVIDGLAANDSGAVAVSKIEAMGAGETLTKTMEVPQTAVYFVAPAIARDDPRFYAEYLLNYIIGGDTLHSRLGQEVRQKQGLVYSINTGLDLKRGNASLGGGFATRNANTAAALEAVKATLSDIHTKGVTTEECEDARRYVVDAFARQLDSAGAVSHFLLSMQIDHLDEDYIEKRAEYFNNVKCSEINEMAASVLNPANFLFAVVGGTPEAGGVTRIAPAQAARPSDTK